MRIGHEDVPNKPIDKLIVKNMNGSNLNSTQPINNATLNMTQEVKASNTINVEDLLNRTAGAGNYASSRSGRKSINDQPMSDI